MIQDIWPLLGWGLVGMAIWMALLWGIHFKIKNAGIVDFGWALGLALLGAYYSIAGKGYVARRWLIGIMVVFWGGRLALHLLFDRILGKPEDPRYAAIRQEWKANLGTKFFFFFEFQALLAVLLSYPFAILATDPTPRISGFEIAGLAIWLVAVTGEALADHQLKRFKTNPANKGHTCQSGLWNYSRHPNYFFEWLIWTAYFVAALAAPYGWISIFCPVLMLYFLWKVTGIPATEAQALRTRGEEYRQYQKTTSAFVPWFKKS